MKRTLWSKQKDAALATRWQAGISAREIARVLGTSEGAVQNRRIRLGLSARPGTRSDLWTPEDDDNLRSLWAEGIAIPYIAAELERSENAVKKRRMLLDLKKRRMGDKGVHVSVNLTKTAFHRVGRRAREQKKTVAEYLRSLIRRDLQEPEED